MRLDAVDAGVARDIVQVAPVLPPRVRHFARALDEHERLAAVACGYVYDPRAGLERGVGACDRLFKTRIREKLSRRAFDGIDHVWLHRRIGAEAWYQLRRRVPLPLISAISGIAGDRGTAASDAYHRAIDEHAAAHLIDERTALVLAREDGAKASFARARRLGIRTVYDLPTAHHTTVRRVIEQEERAFPGISTDTPIARVLSPARVENKEAELGTADVIVVGSTFVKRTLEAAGISPGSVFVLLSACEERLPGPEAEAGDETDALGRGDIVLHVGRLGLAKGTHRLLRAWKRIGAHRTHRLVLIGEMSLSATFLSEFRGCYEHVGAMPRDALWRYYRRALAFVHPSAIEGFAAVILEALSCGVPVIASMNSGADGLVASGVHGLLHDYGDEDRLCEHLERILTREGERESMARAAREVARTWTWRQYRDEFARHLPVWSEEAAPCAGSSAA